MSSPYSKPKTWKKEKKITAALNHNATDIDETSNVSVAKSHEFHSYNKGNYKPKQEG